jgi:hypothetical protein
MGSCIDRGNKIGVPIKASALVSRPRMKKLQSNFQANEQFRQIYKDRLTKVIDSFFRVTDRHTRVNFCDYLNFYGINPVFRENIDGRVYGITFIDNRKGAVINGSDLGNEYSGQALVKRLKDFAADERERQERVEPGLDWPQPEKHDHSVANWMQDIAKEFLDLMKPDKYYPEATNPYLKRRRKRKRVLLI